MLYNVTARLREYLAKTYGLGADASETAVQATVSRAMANDEISIKQLRELTAPVARITEFSTKYITPGMRAVLIEHYRMAKSADDQQAADFLFQCFDRRQIDLKTIREIVQQTPDSFLSTDGEKAMSATNDNGGDSVSSPHYRDVLATAAEANKGGGANVRVKDASECYSNTKSTAVHSKLKVPVQNERGQLVQTISELEYAKAAVFLKWTAARDGVNVVMSEHERALFNEMVAVDAWCGAVGPTFYSGISGERVKALLNDATSGGTELVPVTFDEALILTPLLHSELLPMIDLRPVARGTTIEAGKLGNPTVAWGTAEGTEIALFDTASIADDVNTTVHPVSAAIEVGRDLLSDSPADVGRQLVDNISEAFLKEIDRVIAIGNGTNQPEGIFTASGTTAVASDNGTTGPPTVGDYESMMFAIGKQYRNPAFCAFIANDTSYSRARGIAVGSTDARRVFGMDEQSYRLLEFPYKVQNDIANTKIAFGNLKTYRLYRRQGAESLWYREGHQLARRNANLLVVRGRYGGRIVDAKAWAVMTDAQT